MRAKVVNSKFEKTNKVLKSIAKSKAILLGNGINRVQDARSWQDILIKICNINNIHVEVKENKSYPLTFEEILFSMKGDFNTNLRELKQYIANSLKDYGPFQLHTQIVNLECTDILTTNYDYALEKVINNNYSGVINPGNSEYKFSLYRKNDITEKNIWHIHGELNTGFNGSELFPELSIMIGFEHYSDYLRKIHQLVKPDDAGFTNFLESDKDTWVKRFFTHNIDIIGFSFEYSESHIWWLLNYRARLKNQGIDFNNIIKYNYPDFEEDLLKDRLDLMKSFGVHLNPIIVNNNDYHQFWTKFITDF